MAAACASSSMFLYPCDSYAGRAVAQAFAVSLYYVRGCAWRWRSPIPPTATHTHTRTHLRTPGAAHALALTRTYTTSKTAAYASRIRLHTATTMAAASPRRTGAVPAFDANAAKLPVPRATMSHGWLHGTVHWARDRPSVPLPTGSVPASFHLGADARRDCRRPNTVCQAPWLAAASPRTVLRRRNRCEAAGLGGRSLIVSAAGTAADRGAAQSHFPCSGLATSRNTSLSKPFPTIPATLSYKWRTHVPWHLPRAVRVRCAGRAGLPRAAHCVRKQPAQGGPQSLVVLRLSYAPAPNGSAYLKVGAPSRRFGGCARRCWRQLA